MLSPASVSKGLTAIRSVLSWAVSHGYLEVNPAGGVKHAGARSAEQRSRRLGSAESWRSVPDYFGAKS